MQRGTGGNPGIVPHKRTTYDLTFTACTATHSLHVSDKQIKPAGNSKKGSNIVRTIIRKVSISLTSSWPTLETAHLTIIGLPFETITDTARDDGLHPQE